MNQDKVLTPSEHWIEIYTYLVEQLDLENLDFQGFPFLQNWVDFEPDWHKEAPPETLALNNVAETCANLAVCLSIMLELRGSENVLKGDISGDSTFMGIARVNCAVSGRLSKRIDEANQLFVTYHFLVTA